MDSLWERRGPFVVLLGILNFMNREPIAAAPLSKTTVMGFWVSMSRNITPA